MLGLLARAGWKLADEPDGADLVLVNTCGFLDLAREESLEVIREMLQLKARGRVGWVVVAGCLAQRDGSAILEACPGVDQVLGVFARDQIAALAERLDDPGRPQVVLSPAPERLPQDTDRLRVTPPHLAYLRIAEGCDRTCAFCSIPSIRGRFMSKPRDEILREARQLADEGVRELILVAQDTSSYGRDLAGAPRLAALLAELDQIDALRWIRLMYLYPQHLDDELLEVIASARRILPYLDVPLQHVNDEVLRRMRRGVTRRQTEQCLERLRHRIPNVVLRTTFLVGFPGETDEQFEELVDFVRQERFARLGVFPYRLEPGTASAQLDGQLPEEVRQARVERIMQAQQEVAFAWNTSQVGRTWDVLLDRCIPGEPNAYLGRTWADAPDVDGVVYVTDPGCDPGPCAPAARPVAAEPGQIVSCEIVATEGYDLIGVIVPPAEEHHG